MGVGRLTDSLREHFAPDQIFQDISSIAPGADFIEAAPAPGGLLHVWRAQARWRQIFGHDKGVKTSHISFNSSHEAFIVPQQQGTRPNLSR